jgi:site-specific recombinase XerD
MKLSVINQLAVAASASPYRVCDEQEGEVQWANAFLDSQRLRQLSSRSLRIYAYDLLDFARWFEPQHRSLAEITESTLVDYVRHQLEQDPQPRPQTVNHRLGTVRCCYRFHTGQEIPAGQVHFQRCYTKRSPLGYGRPRTAVARGLRLRQDRRVIVPLSAEEVAKFWQSFRTHRDLALVGLMVLDGLRSCEVLGLQLEDLQLADAQMRVLGKGNKKRTVPLPPGNPRSVRELLAPGKTADQRARFVRLSQRPPARPAHDCGWPSVAVPPSSGVEPSAPGQPA